MIVCFVKIICFLPGSNWRPCACEAHVITTTLRKLDVLKLPWDVDQYKVHLLNVMLVEDENMWLLCLKLHCTTIKSSNFWLRPFLRAFRPIATSFVLWFFLYLQLFYTKQKKCSPNVGLEPTTLRLRVSCSTDWASRAYCLLLLFVVRYFQYSVGSMDQWYIDSVAQR